MAEEEEANNAEVYDGLGLAWFRVILESLCQDSQDCEVVGPHLQGGWVFIVPGLEKGSESVNVLGAIQSGIREVQSSELLAHSV